MSTAPENPVKSDLFKDVKYYVSGTIEPEVSLADYFDNNNNNTTIQQRTIYHPHNHKPNEMK